MKVQKIFLASFAALLMGGLASASTITVNCSTLSGLTELNGSISCAQLSGAQLGTSSLSSIDIITSGGITTTITVTNNTQSDQTGSASTQSTFYVTSGLANFGLANNSSLFTVSASTGLVTVPAGQTVVFGPISETGTTGTLSDTNSATFGAYQGNGTFNINILTATGLFNGIGGGNNVTTQTTSANGTAVVHYNLSDAPSGVPEPATMALFGSALIGLGFFRKRLGAK